LSRDTSNAESKKPHVLPGALPRPFVQGDLEETGREVIGWMSGNCTLLRITDHSGTLLGGPPIGVGGRREALITVTEHGREVLRGNEPPK
jgi:hypothetical protein